MDSDNESYHSESEFCYPIISIIQCCLENIQGAVKTDIDFKRYPLRVINKLQVENLFPSVSNILED